MCSRSDDPFVGLDREPVEEKSESPSRPWIHWPPGGWPARKDDQMVLCLQNTVVTIGGHPEVEVAAGPKRATGARPGRDRLFCFLFQAPPNGEPVATFAGTDEAALLHRLNGMAIGRQRAYFFVIFQPPQNWVAAERISFKLVSVLDVRK